MGMLAVRFALLATTSESPVTAGIPLIIKINTGFPHLQF
jgi:hypothetical protein